MFPLMVRNTDQVLIKAALMLRICEKHYENSCDDQDVGVVKQRGNNILAAYSGESEHFGTFAGIKHVKGIIQKKFQ